MAANTTGQWTCQTMHHGESLRVGGALGVLAEARSVTSVGTSTHLVIYNYLQRIRCLFLASLGTAHRWCTHT